MFLKPWIIIHYYAAIFCLVKNIVIFSVEIMGLSENREHPKRMVYHNVSQHHFEESSNFRRTHGSYVILFANYIVRKYHQIPSIAHITVINR